MGHALGLADVYDASTESNIMHGDKWNTDEPRITENNSGNKNNSNIWLQRLKTRQYSVKNYKSPSHPKDELFTPEEFVT